MTQNISRRSVILGGAAAAVFGFSACASDTKPGTTTSSTTTSTTTSSTTSTTTSAAGSTPAETPSAAPTSTETSASQPASNLSGNLTFAAWDGTGTPQKAAAAFMAANPGVKVTVAVTPWGEYWTKLQTAASAGNAPDVFLMTPANFPLYADNGQLLSIDEQGGAAAAIDKSKYPEGLVKAFEWNGKQYAYPKDIDTIAVFYNKKLFKAAGVAEPTSDWTWDDMVAAAKKITEANKGKGIYGICASAWDQGNFLPTVYANGGETVSDDMKTAHYTDPKTIEGVQMWIDLIDKGYSPNMKQITDTPADDWFKSGRIGIMWSGSFACKAYAEAPALKGNLGVVEMPTIKGKRVSMSNGLGPCVYSKTKNKEAAAALAAFIEGPEGQKIWAPYVVPSLAEAQPLWVDEQKKLGIDPQPFIKAVSYARLMPRSKNTSAWGDKAWDSIAAMWDKKVTVPQGMAQLQDIVTKALAAEK